MRECVYVVVSADVGYFGNCMLAVAQAYPDLIIITGDIVYGSFDDSGATLRWMCKLLDSFEIPWAPVFGNHDNESKMGVAWQCRQLEKKQILSL